MQIYVDKEQMNAAAEYLCSNPSRGFCNFSSQQKAKDIILELIKNAASYASIYTGSAGVFVLLSYEDVKDDIECRVEILVDPRRRYRFTSEIKHAAKKVEINYYD